MMDDNTFVARGQRITAAVLRVIAILAIAMAVLSVLWLFTAALFVGGGGDFGPSPWKAFGQACVFLIVQVAAALAFIFFAPALAALAWSVWPGSNPNIRASLHQMTAPPPHQGS